MKKRRLLSIVLSLCMVLMLMPQMVFADVPTRTPLTKESVSDGKLSLTSGNSYYLSEDIEITETINISGTVTLDLNGHVIKMTGNGSVIKVNGSYFTLQDNSEGKTGAITGGWTSGFGGGVNVVESRFTMEGGTIYDCRATGGGGCVYVGGGSFTMNGGVIDGGYSSNGGGVWINAGSFTMNGGVINSGNDSASNDVSVHEFATIYANGGAVKSFVDLSGQINNTATYGGTIFYGDSNRFGTINGKTVTFKKDDRTYAIEIVAEGNKAAKPIEPTKEGCEFAGWYNGDTEYDFNQPVTDNITLTAHWVIPELVIKGLEDGKTYCDTVQFEVSTTSGSMINVKANDVTLTPDANNKYTLEKGKGTVTVVARDDVGNVRSVTVTVNNGHTAGDDDGDCSTPVYCIYHPDTVVVAAKSHDFSGEWNRDEDGHWHICQNAGCTVAEPKASHSGTDDGDCTTAVTCECGYTVTAANAKHTYGAWQSNGDGTHIRYCTVDGCSGYEDGNCTGGTATCTSKAICEYCKTEYGELDSSNHDLVNTPAKDATVTETGNKEYWQCKDCQKYFSDEEGTKIITFDDTVISKLEPEIIKGEGQSITAGEKKALSFTSNAAYSDFIRVELDGKTLDEKNYTVKEGSTIVTLKADYVATLSAGKHTIGIVSESGTATTTFTVAEKAGAEDSAKTGDDTNLALWLALMLLSGAGITGVTAYTRRKRINE